MLRCLFVLLLTLPMQGCLFFWIPGSLLEGGNVCADETAVEGRKLRHDDGRIGTIEKVIGRSSRCQDGRRPVLVDVRFD